jgi:microcompartment protein CcmL/EutN
MIEAADAMLKTANVVLVSWQKVDAGLVTAVDSRATWDQ